MEIDLYELLKSSGALVIFAAIALGYLIGNISVLGLQLGPTGGVLICALVFGHYGFEAAPIVGTLGFTLFIYCVGLQAGPRFFSVLQEDGKRYFILAIFIAAGSVALVKGLAAAVGLESGIAAGVLAGALTSTPTLVGAQNAVSAGLAVIPEGSSGDALLQDISVGYAITYVFGTVGLMLLVKVLPAVLRIDLADEARKYAAEKGISDGPTEPEAPRPILRAYLVEDERYTGKSIGQIRKESDYGKEVRGFLFKLKRGDEIIEPASETIIEYGDKVAIFASPEQHVKAQDEFHLGREVLDDDLVDAVVDVAEIVIMNDRAIGKSLDEVGILSRYGCFLSKVSRSQIELPLTDETRLQKGDIVTASGEKRALQGLIADLGTEENKVTETDLVTFALGIAAGLLLGAISVKVGNLSIGLGAAGGLLLAGIFVGFMRSLHPTFGRVPPAARYIIMELGLMIFMVSVGLRAGGGIVDALISAGPLIILCGVAATTTPLVVGYFFGRLFLKLNPALLLGALTGAMTSTPALGIVQQAARSSMPALGYAGTYALANVLLTVAGTLMMAL